MKKSLLRFLVPFAAFCLLLSSPVAAAPAQLQASGKMSFLSWYTQEQFQPLLDGFAAKYPDVQIDYQNVPAANNQYNQRLQLLASSGELPDLFYVQPPTSLMAKNGYLADLSNLDVVKTLPAGYKQYYTYDDKVYAYAPDAWVGGVFYNKALFKDNKLEEPKTWADFLAAAKVFNDKGIKPISMGGDELADLIYWLHNTEVLSQDPSFDTKINTGETTFTKGYLDALNTWKKEMIDTGYISQDIVGLTDDQRMTEFATGEAAMTISGPWAVAGIMEKNPKIDLGIFPFVGTTADRAYTVGAVNVGLAVSSKAQNSAAAEAFINFLGSTDGLTLYQAITGNFIGVKDVTYKLNPVMEPMRAFAESGKFAFPPVFWTYTGTLSDMILKGTQEIVLGTLTPEDLVKQLDDKQAELSSGS
jgi:raffinose/stachyose/melibiose transport system substrate-binding protein